VLGNVTIDGKAVDDSSLVRWDDEVIGVRLGDLEASTLIKIETDYRLAGDFADLPNPSLRVEVFKTVRPPATDS